MEILMVAWLVAFVVFVWGFLNLKSLLVAILAFFAPVFLLWDYCRSVSARFRADKVQTNKPMPRSGEISRYENG